MVSSRILQQVLASLFQSQAVGVRFSLWFCSISFFKVFSGNATSPKHMGHLQSNR